MVDGTEAAVLVHGHTGVEEHVAVVHEVGEAVLEEEAHVAAQLVGASHRVHEVVHDALLLGREGVGVVRFQRREVARAQLVLAAVHHGHPALGVHVLQQQAVVHVPVGVAADGLPLQLEEDDRDGLLNGAHAVVGAVGGLGKEGQLTQADAVGALQDLEAVVVDVVADDCSQARVGARRSAHPDDVVVAPLHVDGVVGHEALHNLVGVRSSVEDVAHHVQVVHGQALDERGQRADEVVRAAGVHDGVDDALVVGQARLALVGADVEKLVDDVGVRNGHGLAHLGAGIGAGEAPRQAHQARERDGVPLRGEADLLAKAPQLELGIVDERAEVCLLVSGELHGKGLPDALADDAGAVVEDVLEGLVLAVHVRDEVLGALGQVENGLQVDDLGEDGLRRRELLGEKLQVLPLGRRAAC